MVESVKAQPFLSLDHYNQSLERGYKLLPFRFIRLDATRYVVSNEVGEFVIASAAELHALVDGELEVGSNFYNQLKSKHMIFDEDSNVAIDLLALKIRTKFSQISQFTGLHMFVVSLRCDHSCPYCQVSRQSEDRLAFDMNEETAAKGLDVVFQSPSDRVMRVSG